MSGDIIRRFIELLALAQPSFSEEAAYSIEQQLRHEYGGLKYYIPKKNPGARERLAQQFNGRNAERVAIRNGVHRATIYRAVKNRG